MRKTNAIWKRVTTSGTGARTTRQSEITIRELCENDFEASIELFEAVAAERKWIGTESGFDHDRYREGWRKVLAGEWGAVFVALDAQRLMGYIGIHPHPEYGHVIGMLVDERYRGRGVGAGLLKQALQWARERKLADVSLLVFPHNEAAIALYRKFGFEEREYYPNDVTRATGEVWDSMLMTKTL